MTTFIDTNVLIYLFEVGGQHHQWAISQLEARKAVGPAIVADMVYAEFSVAFTSQSEVDAIVSALALERFPTSDAALFKAGKAFKQYREQNHGTKSNVLPDFLIGAIAEGAGAPLLTANPKDFTGYFPQLQLITP